MKKKGFGEKASSSVVRKKELDKKPKVIRTIKHKKHPIIMNPSYGMNFDNYKQLGIKKLRERYYIKQVINDVNTNFFTDKIIDLILYFLKNFLTLVASSREFFLIL